MNVSSRIESGQRLPSYLNIELGEHRCVKILRMTYLRSRGHIFLWRRAAAGYNACLPARPKLLVFFLGDAEKAFPGIG